MLASEQLNNSSVSSKLEKHSHDSKAVDIRLRLGPAQHFCSIFYYVNFSLQTNFTHSLFTSNLS